MSITKISPSVVDFDDGITITVDDNSNNLTLTSTDADANSGPNLDLYRNSSSPATSDVLGTIFFHGEDGAGNKEEYVRIQSVVDAKGSGSEVGVFQIFTNNAGTLTNNRFEIDGTEVTINESGGNFDFRVESDNNANMLFVDAGNDRVGIGVQPSGATFHVVSSGSGVKARFSDNTSETLDIGITSDSHAYFNQANSGPIAFEIGGTEEMRVTSNGLTFNGDTAAANALDDYEEGTWTPSVPNGGSISNNKSTYTKIGRTVFYYCYIGITLPNDSLEFRIDGLPYNCISTDYYPAGSIGYVAGKDITGTLGPIIQAGQNYLYFHRYDGDGNSVKNNGAFYNSGSSLPVILTGMYET